MNENIDINKSLDDEEIYKQLVAQAKALINKDEPIISSLSNISALLNGAFDKISWVGFYILKDSTLYLGPFQGKVACTVIDLGTGVCGTSASKQQTIIVEDVDKFPGHIACDSESKSEIVVPLANNEKVIGILDIDSYKYASFNETDKKYLEEICKLLVDELELEHFTIM
jgi:GAF domain-containing protein